MIESLADYRIPLKYDGKMPISTGKSRMEKTWKNRSVPWSWLLRKLSEPTRTPETHAEYLKMSKSDQDHIKDVGGFVGGSLRGGRRKSDTVEARQLVTLDADFAEPGLLEDLEMFLGCGYAVYSTHKHSPEKPRFRVLIPLDRPVTPEEYEAISRKLADDIGMDYFDDTTYQPSRLMYWASVSADGEYIFRYCDDPWISADEVLNRYPDWRDTSYWPESSRAGERRRKLADKQGDPLTKSGLIGAFCRTYSIEEAIREFLPNVYVPCALPGRYTYAEGSTAAGLVIYDDHFAYSNHATDPAGGKLCNAFDLVRIHKFGAQDENVTPDTETVKLPSYKAMIEFVQDDSGTKHTLLEERKQESIQDFGEDPEAWVDQLEVGKGGIIANSLKNVRLILQNDPCLKTIVFNQMADNLEIRGEGLPWAKEGRFWRDADDAQLENYLDASYAEFTKTRILSAVTKVADDRAYHPVREYLDNLPAWDGICRVDTLLMDYLGAEGSIYTKSVMRKTLCAAIARVKQPGCKFDYTLTLVGPQGIGKSTLVHKLAGPWYSDSLNLADIRDKTAAEKLQGIWIMEIGELAGMGVAGTNSLKGFISRQDDQYRASYGHRVGHHPRQCIFIGTTNEEEGFLRDTTGGRRWWPVETPRIGNKKVWDLTTAEVAQIWAEALVRYEAGEPLTLEGEAAEEAARRQQAAIEEDPRMGMVQEYLDTLLPEDWYRWDVEARSDWFRYGGGEGSLKRTRVCYQEIWCECFGSPLKVMAAKDRNEIKKILEKLPEWKQNPKKQAIRGYSTAVKVYERRAERRAEKYDFRADKNF